MCGQQCKLRYQDGRGTHSNICPQNPSRTGLPGARLFVADEATFIVLSRPSLALRERERARKRGRELPDTAQLTYADSSYIAH